MQMEISEQIQRAVFEQGVLYGTLLHDSMEKFGAFAPLTQFGTSFCRLVTPYCPLAFDDEANYAMPNLKEFINKITVPYVAELSYGMTHVVGGIFTCPEYKNAYAKLIEDLGGYKPETMIKLVLDIPEMDFATFTYNTDAHWIDIERKLILKYTPYFFSSQVALDIMCVEVFPPYCQYALHRKESSEQCKRMAAAIFYANAQSHHLVYNAISKIRPEYGNKVFMSCIDEMNNMLINEAKIAMSSINT
jgi:hypothetical protein